MRDSLHFFTIFVGTFTPNVTLSSKAMHSGVPRWYLLCTNITGTLCNPLSDGFFRSPCRGFVVSVWVVLCFQFHFYTVIPTRGQKVKSAAARCKGTAGQRNMAGVGFDPVPLRATRFKCMTECKKTGANGYPGRVQRSDGKGQKKRKGAAPFPIVAARLSFPATHFFSWKKKKKSLWSRLPFMVSHNTRAHTLWEKSPHSRPNARQKFPNTLVQCERSKTMPGSVSVSHTFIKAKVCRMGVQRLLNGSWLSTPGMCCATAHGKCSSNLRNHMKTRALIYANTIKDNWYIYVRSYRKQEQSIAWTYGKPLHKNHTSPTSYVSRCKLLFK